MAQPQGEYEVVIRPDGSVTMEGRGFTGPACEGALSRALRAALGSVGRLRRTPEYYRGSTEATVERETHRS